MRLHNSGEPEERGNPIDAVVGEFRDARGRKACPYAMQVADMLTSFKPHYASQKELDAHGGICKKCAAKVKKSAASRAKKHDEEPVEIKHESKGRNYWEANTESPGIRDATRVSTTDFDFDGVDAALAGISKHPKSSRDSIFDAFEKLFAWCFSEKRVNIAAVRFAVIGDNLCPELIGSKTNQDLARQLGVSRQVFSKTRKAFQNHFGVRLKSLRSASSQAGHKARV